MVPACDQHWHQCIHGKTVNHGRFFATAALRGTLSPLIESPSSQAVSARREASVLACRLRYTAMPQSLNAFAISVLRNKSP